MQRRLQLTSKPASVWLAFLGLLYALEAQAEVTFGLLSSQNNSTLAEFSVSGQWDLFNLYQPENDIPAQRVALEELYIATQGQNWTPGAYFSTVPLEEVEEFAYYYANYSGTVYVDFSMFVGVMLLKVPWFTPGFSYCRWWGVECCLTASEASLPSCTQGLQSIGALALAGGGLVGTLPPIYNQLPDLTLLFISNNPELVGVVDNVTDSVRANLQLFQLSGTLLQTPCATPSANGKSVTYNTSCTSNLFAWNTQQQSASSNKEGMICPGLLVSRPASVTNLSTAFYNNVVSSDPLLYSYQGCTCALPLVAHYTVDTAGFFQMDCIAVTSAQWIWDLIGPLLGLLALSLLLLWLVLNYRARLLQAWETRHINALKRRNAPGTLMERQGKGMDLFHSGVTLVMSSVEGLEALSQATNARCMGSALTLSDNAMRSVLPKYCGYEVLTEADMFVVAFHDPVDAIGWCLHVQLALLEAPWPSDLLQQPQAKVENCQDGKLLFRGLRLRMAINTGVPAEIIVHSNHRHVEYRGEIVELTNSLLQLPAGGQVLLSDTTFQRIGGRLHEIKLPDFHFQKPAEGPRNSIDRPRNSIDGPRNSIEGPRNSIEGPRNSIEGQSRKDLEGQIKLKFEGQSKRDLDGQTKGKEGQITGMEGQTKGVEGQGSEAGSNPSSRRSSVDSTSRLAAVSATAKSADRPVNPTLSLMARGAPPTMEEKLRMQRMARGRRFSLDPTPTRPPPMQRFSLTPQSNTDLICAMPHEDLEEDPLSASQASPAAATAADAAASTALASLLRTSCTIIDMGSYVLSECRNRAYTADDAALPCIAGEHVRQILPEALVERAALFPPFDPARQVAPSFFDAPGAQDTSSATAGVGSAGLLQPAPPSTVSLASVQRLSDELPNITFAFASEVGYKEVSRIDKQQALIALGRFKSCVRTSLLLCGGYECQEKEGTFMIAFPQPKTAVEWALTLQLALLRLPWGEGLLGLAPTQEERSPVTGQLLFRGLSARVGIFHGPIVKLCPHSTTGRADYFGTPVNRAARFWSGCNAGQILVEKALIETVGLEWAGAEGSAGSGPAPAAASSHIATRNFALLTQRMESDLAASRSTYSFSSTLQTGRSGKDGSSLKRTTSAVPRVSFGNARASMDMQLPAVYISDEKGYLSPMGPGRNPRRSVDTPSHFKPVFGPAPTPTEAEEGSVRGGDVQLATRNPSSSLGKEEAAKVTKQRAAQALVEKKTPRRPSVTNDLQTVAVPSKSLDFAGLKKSMLYLNPAFGDTLGRGQEKISVPRLETAGKEASSGLSGVPELHLGVCGTLPSLPVKVEVYHMGQYSYKGINEPTDVCQILPASLSERRTRHQEAPVIANGKVTCLKKDDSFHFTAQVPLPSVFHLPLAAEPPLYINIVQSSFQSFSAMSHSSNPRVTRA